MAAVSLQNLTLGYEGRPVLRGLSGAFPAGKLTGLAGPNGSGKSTLLKGLAGVLDPLGGRIDRGGLDWRDIAYLPQDAGLDRQFPITVEELVGLGLWARQGLFGAVSRADRARRADVLASLGLTAAADRPVAELSGGQLQRALFARVLLQDARLVLLDEPFSALDERTAADLVRVVRGWAGEGRTVVLVLHDLSLARELCDEVLLLAGEVVSWGPTPEALTSEALGRARRWAQACEDPEHQHGEERL